MEAEKQELENLLRVYRATTKSGTVTLLTTEAIKPVLIDGVPIHYNENWVLGKGSQGTVVYRGTFGNKPVAVKRMHLDPVKEKAIIKEIETLKKCDLHENIVQYFSTQLDHEHVLIALELCDTSLKGWVTNKRSIDISPVEVLRQVTVGLRFLHQRYIIHRDLKPENILLCSPTKNVKISDFGLSRHITGDNNYVRTDGAGNLEWVAPEVLTQIVSEDVASYKFSFASDLFALGGVYYYVLSNGQHPFGDVVRRSANILDGNVQIDPLLLTGVCGQTAKLLHLMVAVNPKLRPSCTDLLSCPSFWTPEHRHLFLDHLESQGYAVMQEVIHFKASEHCTFDHALDIQSIQALNTFGNRVGRGAGCAIYCAFLKSIEGFESSEQAHVLVDTDDVERISEENIPTTSINTTLREPPPYLHNVEEMIRQHNNKAYYETGLTNETTEQLLQRDSINRINYNLDTKSESMTILRNKYCWAVACLIVIEIAIAVGVAVFIFL